MILSRRCHLRPKSLYISAPFVVVRFRACGCHSTGQPCPTSLSNSPHWRLPPKVWLDLEQSHGPSSSSVTMGHERCTLDVSNQGSWGRGWSLSFKPSCMASCSQTAGSARKATSVQHHNDTCGQATWNLTVGLCQSMFEKKKAAILRVSSGPQGDGVTLPSYAMPWRGSTHGVSPSSDTFGLQAATRKSLASRRTCITFSKDWRGSEDEWTSITD